MKINKTLYKAIVRKATIIENGEKFISFSGPSRFTVRLNKEYLNDTIDKELLDFNHNIYACKRFIDGDYIFNENNHKIIDEKPIIDGRELLRVAECTDINHEGYSQHFRNLIIHNGCAIGTNSYVVRKSFLNNDLVANGSYDSQSLKLFIKAELAQQPRKEKDIELSYNANHDIILGDEQFNVTIVNQFDLPGNVDRDLVARTKEVFTRVDVGNSVQNSIDIVASMAEKLNYKAMMLLFNAVRETCSEHILKIDDFDGITDNTLVNYLSFVKATNGMTAPKITHDHTHLMSPILFESGNVRSLLMPINNL